MSAAFTRAGGGFVAFAVLFMTFEDSAVNDFGRK